jgi:hypothetical protein
MPAACFVLPEPLTNGSVVAESLAARLAHVTLPDADGNGVRLGSLWETGPGVLVFLRHYG